MSEWPNERAWKVRVLAMVPWVRIPPSPQRNAVRPKADGIFGFRRYEHSSYKHGTKNDTSGVKRSDSISLLVPPKGINEINPTLSARQMLFHLWWRGIFIWRSSSSLERTENKNAGKRSGSIWLDDSPSGINEINPNLSPKQKMTLAIETKRQHFFAGSPLMESLKLIPAYPNGMKVRSRMEFLRKSDWAAKLCGW